MNGSRAWFEKDFYSVLGVAERATAEEIKRAFKKLARQHHPDRNPGNKQAEERMKEISEANEVLSDAEKRGQYDQMRHFARSGFAGGGRGTGWQTNIRFEDLPFDVGDLFGDLFGSGRARRAQPRRGADVETAIRISFEDAVHGVTVPVRAGGDQLKVRVPAGINDGSRIRARGRGQVSTTGGGSGDLFVRVIVEPHRLFGRQGSDLTVTVFVSFGQATLGAKVAVPTLDGPVTLKVPPGTQSGKTFRVRAKGAPKPRGGRGDLLATVRVTVPQKLSREQRELIEKLAALDPPARASDGV